MKVVLTQDHDTLGINGNIVEVSEGYARNFLLPKNLAVRATENVVQHFENRKKAIAKKEAAKLENAQAAATKMEALTIVIKARVGEEGKLYGTITTKDIAQALNEQHQQDVDKKRVEINDPIRYAGDHNIVVKVHPLIKASIKVVIEAEDE